jgi:ferredoxin-type protein NapH
MKIKRQLKRNIIGISLFLFMPILMKLFSPIMTIKTALLGVISASILMIIIMFIAGMLSGKLWCGWLCPAGALQDIASNLTLRKKVSDGFRNIKYILVAMQLEFIIIALAFIAKDIAFYPFYGITFSLTASDLLMYYIMVILFFGLPFLLGKRSYCNHFCVIAPIMTLGIKTGALLGIKRKKIQCDSERCIDCMLCNKNCPCALDVNAQAKQARITHVDCVNCLACVDCCPKKVFAFKK